jgi:hydrogenase nickel incorporation protein HypA/HybF
VHELAIVDALIQQVQSEVDRAGAKGRVMRLDLVVGRLSGVYPDAVRFAFEMLSPGTILEAARIEIEEPRAVCCCAACGERTPIDDLFGTCPKCESPNISIEGGQELLLQSIEVEGETP